MGKKRSEPIDALTKIITERQPVTLCGVRQYAACYVAMKHWTREEMYDFIRANFDVDGENKVTLRGE
jgi:hypothetical protein